MGDLWRQIQVGVEATHPVLFFLAMALLPLGPFPASVLFISAGVRFGAGLGFVLAMGALAVNVVLGYFLAHRVVRRPLEGWVTRRGYAIPRFERGDELRLLLLFRITPGMPLFVQNYVLGLSGVRFRLYLAVSLLAQVPFVFGFVWFGQSLTETSVWKVALAVCAVVAAVLLTSLLRRWLARRRSGDGGSAPT